VTQKRIHEERKTKMKDEMNTRTCTTCGQTKPLSEFHKGKNRQYCKPCGRYGYRMRKLHVTVEALARQENRCPICEREFDSTQWDRKPVWDHKHGVGTSEDAHRGITCGACNKALGLFRDDRRALQNAIRYLEREPEQAELWN
jgi:hypothetical protein